MNQAYPILEIGSGSYKLLLEGVFSERFQSSLGKGLKDHKLHPDSVNIALSNFQNQIIPYLAKYNIKPEDLLVFATAAIREAMKDPEQSGQKFIDKLKNFGIKDVKVFSENEECIYAAKAVYEELKDEYQNFLMLDTGGASHQLVEFKNGEIALKKSFPIGSHTDFSKVSLPNFLQYGFTKRLPIVLIGTAGLIVNHIPNIDRTKLKQIIETIEPLDIPGRREFLKLMVPDQSIHKLFVDFRLEILPKAFRIMLNCVNNIESPEFLFSAKQAINYISRHGFQ